MSVLPSSEALQGKPAVITDSATATQQSDLGTANIPGSAGSFEVLEAALKKTFNKNNGAQGTSTTSSVANDATDSPSVNPDDPSITKPATNATASDPPPPVEENGPSTNVDSTPSISAIVQTQSQPTTMLSNQQQQILQNSLLIPQGTPSFSCSSVPSTQHTISSSTPANETAKQPIHPLVVTSSTAEPMENGPTSMSISPTPSPMPATNETGQSPLPSDTPSQVTATNSITREAKLLCPISCRYPVVCINWTFFS